MKLAATLLATLTLSTSLSLNAMAADAISKPGAMGGMKADAAMSMAAGEVKKIDKDAGKITLRHEALENAQILRRSD